ncbi:hypothetical protein BGZ70_000917 [Mortierella alpina]|uniref:Uncharacterized protein n=1 Tax=Mortierella alpina TaxID=64518 RepID=A0A9P6JCA5_MORAP|nr:hypothetical protein BGZ70_000917 [Mortierella alpina]
MLVLAMNLATFEGVFRINTPVQLKIVYSVIYSLYALLGVVAGVTFHRLVPNRRFKVLIVLYWILIILIITEGVYFGIMMSKLKSKFVSYCQEIPYPGTGRGTPATASPAMPTSVSGGNETVIKGQHGFPHPMPCNKPHAVVGAFYIVGPGGWVILHCAWIMIIALYSKALRREHPADEECGPMKDAGRVYAYQPPPKTTHGFFGRFSGAQTREQSGSGEKTGNNMEMLSGIHQHQQHPFQTAITASPAPQPQPTSSGMSAMFRGMKSRSASNSPELDRRQSGQSGENGQQKSATHDTSDDDSDEEDLQRSHHARAARGSGSEGSTSLRGDIPADGKGWWIRQIEGKRRGEICPCTLGSPFNAEEDGSCWCGKQRQAGQTRVSLGSSSQTMRGRDSRSTLLRPVSPGSHSATASSAIDEPLNDVVAADFKADAPAKDAL